MKACSIVDKKTGEVVNKILLDEKSEWHPPEGCEIIHEDAEIGDKFVNGKRQIQDRLQPKKIEEPPYDILREGEYPHMGDQLDAIWKELNYRRMQGEELTQEADDMLGQVLAVKKKYPKPSE